MKNTETKNKRRLNFIDIIIIAALIAVVAFVVYIFAGDSLLGKLLPGSGNASDAYVRYTVTVNSVDDKHTDTIKTVTELFQNDLSIGIVEDINFSPAESIELNERTEELVLSYYPDRKKVKINLAAKGRLENGVVTIGKLKVVVGSYVEFKSRGFKSYGYITSMELLEEVPDELKEKLSNH